MDRPRFYRGLRIAVSAVWLLLCMLPVVMCVRSFYAFDVVAVPIVRKELTIANYAGEWILDWDKPFFDNASPRWSYVTAPVKNKLRFSTLFWGRIWGKFNTFGWEVRGPHCVVILLSCTLAPLPLIRWRFSLRSLLIATSLVAVLLGLVVWSSS